MIQNVYKEKKFLATRYYVVVMIKEVERVHYNISDGNTYFCEQYYLFFVPVSFKTCH